MRAASLQKLTQGHRARKRQSQGRTLAHWDLELLPRVFPPVNLLKGKPKHQSHRKAEISTMGLIE